MTDNWFQESPNSYKIQVLYRRVPEYVKTEVVDTPFRFATYEDAQSLGKDVFKGVAFRVVGSSDEPHWQGTPIQQALPEALGKKVWYELYGVKKPSQQAMVLTPKKQQKAYEVLSKLKPQVQKRT
jgi:hypothetical protein